MVIIPHEVALVAGPEIRIWVILGKYLCKRQPRLIQLPTQTCRFSRIAT